MAELKHWYLICYDIREAKRWRKVYKLLQGYGESIQLSIFRCWLSQREREKLRWELEKLLTPEDSIFLVGLCHRCVERLQLYNRPEAWVEEESSYRVL
jgi:CRISPR-associated protein Cas2